MRFGNLLNELLLEYWNGSIFKGDDLYLSVADDSPDFFVFTVDYIKGNRIIGTFTVTTEEKPDTRYNPEANRVIKIAKIKHEFYKVPNKQIMMQAYGLFPEVLTTYMGSFENPEDKPSEIYIVPNTAVEARTFRGSDFDALMYNIKHGYGGDADTDPLYGYYRNSTPEGGVKFQKYDR
jgi:hypothetical protein